MNIEDKIKTLILNSLISFKLEVAIDIHLEHPSDVSNGDYSTNIAFALSQELHTPPLDIANELVQSIKKVNEIDRIEIAGPGFINFYIKKNIFLPVIREILEDEKNFGKGTYLEGKKILFEFAHPNPFKSFHIGHLRNIILGESIIRLLEAQGAEVIRVNYQGDVGMHIAKNIWALQKINPSDYPDSTSDKVKLLGKTYTEGALAFEKDTIAKQEITEINKKIYSQEDPHINKLWELGKKWSFAIFHEIYNRVYTTFDREYMETEVAKLGMEKIKEALDKNILKESDGAVIFDGTKYGLDIRVFLNSNGLPTYEGKELGIAYREFTDFGEIDLCVHNVAIEQISFFKVTFKVEELLDSGLFKGKQYHNSYEFVGLKNGKMSSRKGHVVLGNDILNQACDRLINLVKADNKKEVAEMIAVGAVKYSFLKINSKTYLSFDLDESIDLAGDSGPYIMYTIARINSILDKSNKFEVSIEALNIDNFSENEMLILKLLNRYSDIIAKSAKYYAPNHLCRYLYELAQLFNTFYNSSSILKTTDNIKNQRILISKAVKIILENGLFLLGIKSPEKM